LGYNPEGYDHFYKTAIQKGYNPDLLEKAGLVKNRSGMYHDVYRGRVIFPIQSMTGRVLGFGARILKSNEKAPKYINTPENELYNKSRVLYGMYQSRQAIGKLDECFLVEGYTDVISLHQGGVENVVASSGTSLTEDQLRLIGQLTKNLTILYDGDAAGVKAALRGLDMALGQSFNVKLVLFPEGDDPDSFIQKAGAAKFHDYVTTHKQDVIGFRLEVGMKEAANDPVQKSKLVNEIAESISRINKAEDFALQDHYIREATRKLQVEEAGFINLVNKYIREKVDGDKKYQQRRTEQAPEPAEAGTVDIPAERMAPANGDEQQEWELVRVLLDQGGKEYEGFANVAELIHNRIDPELIETLQVREIYDSYFHYKDTFGNLPDISYFVSHPDVAIQHRIAGLFQTKDSMSEKWKTNYGIETLNGEFNYLNEVDSMLAYFELKKIKSVQAEIMNRLKTEQDINRVTALHRKFLELKQSESEVVKKMGTVIVKQLGR
jgi:DNA primase